MYTYVLLDVNNICTGFVEISKKVIRIGYLPIEQRDLSLIGKVWDYETQTWKDGPLSDQEQAALDTAVNIEYLACLADLGL